MAKFWRTPFASTGDKTVIPDATQPDGSVSNSTGYTPDYALEYVDPNSKDIERAKLNWLMFAITEALGEIQGNGAPLWQSAGQPYGINAVVRHNDAVWQSVITNNTETPSAGLGWRQISNSSTPTGMVSAFAGSAAPAGWVLCNGAAISRADNAALFTAIGTTYGSGNGTTTFNVPDLRGEFVRGLDAGRGIDAGRSLGSNQGFMVQSHGHNIPTQIISLDSPGGAGATVFYGGTTYTTESFGGTETRPRNVAMNYIIKT